MLDYCLCTPRRRLQVHRRLVGWGIAPLSKSDCRKGCVDRTRSRRPPCNQVWSESFDFAFRIFFLKVFSVAFDSGLTALGLGATQINSATCAFVLWLSALSLGATPSFRFISSFPSRPGAQSDATPPLPLCPWCSGVLSPLLDSTPP